MQNNTIELQREVVRVVVRNVLKTVKISFWSDQLKTLEQAGFRKKQMVLFEDIKKKKSIFLDFTGDSNFIDLDSDLDLKASFAQLLPAV